MSLARRKYKARESRQVRCKSWQISFGIPRSELQCDARNVSEAEHVGESHTCAYRKPEALGAEVGMMMRLKESPEPPPPGKVPLGSEPVTSLVWLAQSRAGSTL